MSQCFSDCSSISGCSPNPRTVDGREFFCIVVTNNSDKSGVVGFANEGSSTFQPWPPNSPCPAVAKGSSLCVSSAILGQQFAILDSNNSVISGIVSFNDASNLSLSIPNKGVNIVLIIVIIIGIIIVLIIIFVIIFVITKSRSKPSNSDLK